MKNENGQPSRQLETEKPIPSIDPNRVEEAWHLDPADEAETLAQLKSSELDLIADQLEKFGHWHPETASRGYRTLIERNPGHPQEEEWKAREKSWLDKTHK